MTTTCDTRPRILVADDQPAVLESLRLLLAPEGFDLDTASGPDGLIDALQRDHYDLVLMDMNYSSDTTSGGEGLDVLSRITALDTDLPVVVMTGWSSVELAVATMRARAADFVQKPWDNMTLLSLIRREVEEGRNRRAQHRREVRELEDARLIQRQLLPAAMPVMPGWEIATSWRPANGVSGDYFDAILFSDTRMGICIADVVGKGLPAALLMSSVQAVVKALAPELTRAARPVCEGQPDSLRVDGRRQIHQLLFRRARCGEWDADIYQRGTQRAVCDPARGSDRALIRGRDATRLVCGIAIRASGRALRRGAIASSCSPTASQRPPAIRAKSSGRKASSPRSTAAHD